MTPWKAFDTTYFGFGYNDEGRKRQRPRDRSKRLSSRRDKPGCWYLTIKGYEGDFLVSRRKINYRVGRRLVDWLRRRGHLAILSHPDLVKL